MNVEDLAAFALQRVTAYDGLAIDAATWTDAHAYHQMAQRLHARALHGWGIAGGLQVTAIDPPGRAVILQPGLAIDRDGNTVRVPQPVRLALPAGATGTLLFILRYVETAVDTGNGTQPSRVREYFNLFAEPPPLRPGDIEVARVEITGASAPIREPADPWAPGAQEIDQRSRRQIRLPTGESLAVAQLVLGDQPAMDAHRRGLISAVRELQAGAPFVAQFVGDLRVEAAVGACNLLYLAGAGPLRISPREGTQLLAFLRSGGILFAEACAELEEQRQENGRFVATFSKLMADLKHELAPLERTHPVFASRYVFGSAPDGLGGHAPLLGSGNVILNPNDYGCCWQGGTAGKPQSREAIRSATEFLVNLAWLAVDDRYLRLRMGTERLHTAERAG